MKPSIPLLLGLIGMAGCATVSPSPELVNARQAYERARASQAAQAAPDSVISAKQALDKAEAAYMDDAGSMEERSMAYIAERRAMRAIAEGNQRIARQVKTAADKQYVALQSELRQDAEQQLEQASGKLEGLSAEQAQADAALQDLSKFGQLRKDARGTTLVVSGTAMFETGSAEIMTPARAQLDQIAQALAMQGQARTITIEGHSDARGSEEKNQKLSQERAEAVRDYLASHGVPAERITAVGKGEAEPVASNDSEEGRAANRRVEIVIGNGLGSSPGSTSPGSTSPGSEGGGQMEEPAPPRGTTPGQ